MLAAIGRLFSAILDRITGGMRTAIEEQQQQIRILELAFGNQQRNIETLNEMLVTARLRTKEVRDECVQDGLALKMEITDLKTMVDELRDERRG